MKIVTTRMDSGMNECMFLPLNGFRECNAIPLNNGTAYIHLTSWNKLMLFMFELSFVYVLSLSSLSNPCFEIA